MSSAYDALVSLSQTFPIILSIKKWLYSLEEWFFGLRCYVRKTFRSLVGELPIDKCIGILCVKNVMYSKMAIKNANSLHFFDSSCKIYFYCDSVSGKFLKSRLQEFDYPNNIEIIQFRSDKKVSWQAFRFEALKQISGNNGALVDADSRWFSNPPNPGSKVVFLTKVNNFVDNADEGRLLALSVKGTKWKSMCHYASGYIYLPQKYASSKLFDEIENLRKRLVSQVKQSHLPAHLLRLADEIALNVAIQNCVAQDEISVLKQKDGPGNRSILLSYYYGYWNQIGEM